MKIGVPCLKLKLSRDAAKGKHAGYARAVACEALEERWGSDDDIDESRSHLNTYVPAPGWEDMGFESGQVLSDWWRDEAAKQVRVVRTKVSKRDADGNKVVDGDGHVVYETDDAGNFVYEEHERKLRDDAGVGFAVIAKVESEWLNAQPLEVQDRFTDDLTGVTCDVLAEHGLVVQVVATHYDEQSRHPHILGYDPDYNLGRKMSLKLFGDFNREIPRRMRELGWADVEDCAAYDAEKVEAEIAEATADMDDEAASKYREDYMAELIAVKKSKKRAGRNSKKYKADRDEERAAKAKADAVQAERDAELAAYDAWPAIAAARQSAEEAAFESDVLVHEAEAERDAAMSERDAARRERDKMRRARDAYAGDEYRTKGGTALGVKGLQAEQSRLMAENAALAKRIDDMRGHTYVDADGATTLGLAGVTAEVEKYRDMADREVDRLRTAREARDTWHMEDWIAARIEGRVRDSKFDGPLMEAAKRLYSMYKTVKRSLMAKLGMEGLDDQPMPMDGRHHGLD